MEYFILQQLAVQEILLTLEVVNGSSPYSPLCYLPVCGGTANMSFNLIVSPSFYTVG